MKAYELRGGFGIESLQLIVPSRKPAPARQCSSCARGLRVFAFDEIREALCYMESGSHFGKVGVRR